MRFLFCDVLSKRCLATLFACLVAALVATPVHAQYQIQPGDAIRLSVPSVPELTTESLVDLDGRLRLPVIGEVVALGLTLAELHEQAGRLIEARPYRRFGSDGVPIFIQLSGEDIQVNIAAYRPVYVSGDVLSPGPVPYRPGLTVRAAIANAGGARRGLTEVDRPRPQDEARLLGDRATAANEIAELRMAEWRLLAELAVNPATSSPDRAEFPVSDYKFKELLEIHRQLLNSAIKQRSEQHVFLGLTELQLDERLTILQQQAETQRSAVEVDETELSRISSLFDKGIVRINRLIDIRRAQLASATRLLQTEDGVARVTLDRSKVSHDLEILEIQYTRQVLDQLRKVRRQLSEAHIIHASISEQLAAIYGWPNPKFELSIVILHAKGNRESAAMEEMLQPGDVLSVSITLATDTNPSQ